MDERAITEVDEESAAVPDPRRKFLLLAAAGIVGATVADAKPAGATHASLQLEHTNLTADPTVLRGNLSGDDSTLDLQAENGAAALRAGGRPSASNPNNLTQSPSIGVWAHVDAERVNVANGAPSSAAVYAHGQGGAAGVDALAEVGPAVIALAQTGDGIVGSGDTGVVGAGGATGVRGSGRTGVRGEVDPTGATGAIDEFGLDGRGPAIGARGAGRLGVVGISILDPNADPAASSTVTSLLDGSTSAGVIGIGAESQQSPSTGVLGVGDAGVVGRAFSDLGTGLRGEAPTGTGVSGQGATGVSGQGATGVLGTSEAPDGHGVRGDNPNGDAVRGEGRTGIHGRSEAPDGHGVRGENANGSGVRGEGATGVHGRSETAGGRGIHGEATHTDGAGVRGDNPNGVGVRADGRTAVEAVAPRGGVGVRAVVGQGGAPASARAMAAMATADDPALSVGIVAIGDVGLEVTGTESALHVRGKACFDATGRSGRSNGTAVVPTVSRASTTVRVGDARVTDDSIIHLMLATDPGRGPGNSQISVSWINVTAGVGFDVHLTNPAQRDVQFRYFITEPC